jgi:hypothetical protein
VFFKTLSGCFLKRSHRTQRPTTPMSCPGHVLSLEKNPACPRLAQLRKLHLKLQNFFQPATFFTEMLRFDKKNRRNFSEISLQLLKLLSIKKRKILEKSRKNKIFIISGFNDKKSPGVPFMLEIPMHMSILKRACSANFKAFYSMSSCDL